MNKINRSLKRAYDVIDDDLEGALTHISIAVDAIAKDKYPHLGGPKQAGARIRKFIADNEAFIMILAMPNVQAIAFQYTIGGKIFRLPEIFYKLIRCSLLHGDGFEKSLVFDSGPALGVKRGGKFIVSYAMVNAFALAVLTDPENSGGSFSEQIFIRYNVNGTPEVILLNNYFGKQAELLQRVGLSVSVVIGD